MDDRDDRFEILSLGQMKQKYYRPGEEPPLLRLSPENVPESLRNLISLAERWGISDDTLRRESIKNASRADVDELQRTVTQFDDELDAWLAGPDAASAHHSAEYLAFSNMRMAADGC